MEKTYLKWYNKVGYGSGDIAGNVRYALLASFVLIYLTDTVGPSAAVGGRLMLCSRPFDGLTGIVSRSIIERPRTPLGSARTWLFGACSP